jgi:hypothetical protein
MPRVIQGIAGFWWWSAVVDDFGVANVVALGWTPEHANRRALKKYQKFLDSKL